MAELDANQVIGILHGKIGTMTFVRTKQGKVYVRKSPVRTAEATAAERATQLRFKLALAYIKALRREHPDEYGAYIAAARLAGKRACDLANADFRHSPEITDVGLAQYHGGIGEVISVQAIDDFEVLRVLLAITDVDGTLLEEGAAVLDANLGQWHYAGQLLIPADKTVVVRVTASDRPGNTATKKIDHVLRPNGV